ncbi:MAG: MBL fold metallo-hydrolase [Candidatus Hadarchaeales archaeon]
MDIGNGEIRVAPLAAESFGVRSLAVAVETDDVKIVVDPGSALGPRFNLPPHEKEYFALASSRKRIFGAARRADVLTISHYHFDHYLPGFEDWTWILSSPELAEGLYRGKLILAKDPGERINVSQRKRGHMFWKMCSEIAELKAADGRSFEFGRTRVEFSQPVFHGGSDALGYEVMLTVKTPGCAFVHASDVQGPVEERALEQILLEKPDAVMIGGPPTYLKGFKVGEKEVERARENLKKLAGAVELLIVDHHLLRDAGYMEFLAPVVREAERKSHRVMTAAEAAGEKPGLLEAFRRELHEKRPVPPEWYEKLERGELKETVLP